MTSLLSFIFLCALFFWPANSLVALLRCCISSSVAALLWSCLSMPRFEDSVVFCGAWAVRKLVRCWMEFLCWVRGGSTMSLSFRDFISMSMLSISDWSFYSELRPSSSNSPWSVLLAFISLSWEEILSLLNYNSDPCFTFLVFLLLLTSKELCGYLVFPLLAYDLVFSIK